MNLQLGKDGDLVIGLGAGRISGKEYTAQLINCRLKTLLGEWKLNPTIGVPWFTDLLKQNYNLELVYSWVLKILRSTAGVKDVTNLTLGVEGSQRKLYISFEVSTVYGGIQNIVEV